MRLIYVYYRFIYFLKILMTNIFITIARFRFLLFQIKKKSIVYVNKVKHEIFRQVMNYLFSTDKAEYFYGCMVFKIHVMYAATLL